MYEVSLILMFAQAHVVAWFALGGGWSGAARAPFAVALPAASLILLKAVFFESYGTLATSLGTLLAWEGLYLFAYITARVAVRAAAESPS